jgi:acetyl esterase/lipase
MTARTWMIAIAAVVASGHSDAARAQPAPDARARIEAAARQPLAYRPTPAGPCRVVDLGEALSPGAWLALPCAQAQPFPVALLVHGGLPAGTPIRPSQWRVYREWGAALAGRGVATLMIDHSLGFPDRALDRAIDELDAALAWLVTNRDVYNFEPGQLRIVAFSAGGLLVPELLGPARPLRAERIALFYPMTGAGPLDRSPPSIAARMRLAEAAPRLGRSAMPLLIVRASADANPGLLPLLDESIAALVAAEANLTIRNVPGARHGFDAGDPEPLTCGAIEDVLRFVSDVAHTPRCDPQSD